MGNETRIVFRVTPEQKKILETKMKSAGFDNYAYYIRAVLFRSISAEEKIDAIYKKICRNN